MTGQQRGLANFSAAIPWLIAVAGFGIFTLYIRNNEVGLFQLAAAAAAAIAMFWIGYKLTVGQGALASAGQIEKIGLWSALALSVVSAVTTTVGLQALLSANAGGASTLGLGLAVILGLGIQCTMLATALSIGKSYIRLGDYFESKQAGRSPGATSAGNADTSWRRIVVAMLLLSIGIAIWIGFSAADLWAAFLQALFGERRPTGTNILGPILVALAIVLLLVGGLFTLLARIAGLTLATAYYLALLLVSSGFGVLFYFQSIQSPDVIVIDRDNYIETQTPALARMMIAALEEDIRVSRIEATAGDDFDDLSDRIVELIGLFRAHEAQVDVFLDRARQRARQAADERAAARQAVIDANGTLQQAETALVLAQQARDQAQSSLDTTRPGLDAEIADQQSILSNTLTGNDGTRPIRGPIARAAEAAIARNQEQIRRLESALTSAEAVFLQRRAERDNALIERDRLAALVPVETAADTGSTSASTSVQRPDDLQSLLTDFAAEPTNETLNALARNCGTVVQGLIGQGISVDPDLCDVSLVRAHLDRLVRAESVIDAARTACAQTEEEQAADRAAALNPPERNPDAIPPHLLARLGWLSRCVLVANTGSERMSDVVARINRLESEFTTPGFDVRRVISALFDGNRFAVMSLMFALGVDFAILFAGIRAIGRRGTEFAVRTAPMSATDREDQLRETLATVSGDNPAMLAQRIVALARPSGNSGSVYVDISAPDYEIDLSNLDPAEAQGITLVLLAAGNEFAWMQRRGPQSYWRVRRNLLDFLIRILGEGRGSSPRPGATTGYGSMALPAPRVREPGLLPYYANDSSNRSGRPPAGAGQSPDPLDP